VSHARREESRSYTGRRHRTELAETARSAARRAPRRCHVPPSGTPDDINAFGRGSLAIQSLRKRRANRCASITLDRRQRRGPGGRTNENAVFQWSDRGLSCNNGVRSSDFASCVLQRPQSSGAARTRRLTRWPPTHDLPLTALGLAHGHRRTDNELRFVRRLIGPRRPTAVRGGALVAAPCLPAVRRETKTLNRVRAGASPGEEREECVSRCDFQSHIIKSANMF